MPKKTKAIPDDRAEWSFGDALYWHFFIHGTRPEGSPVDRTGMIWDPKKAAAAVGVTIRAFWNWVDDRHFPYDTAAIERALFGTSRQFDDARNELRRLLLAAREHRRIGDEKPIGGLPAVIPGQLVTLYTTPFEASEVDGPLEPEDVRAMAPWASENFGKTGGNQAQTEPITLGSVFGRGSEDDSSHRSRTASPDAETGPTARGKSKVVGIVIAGLALLLAGYGLSRHSQYAKESPGTVTTTPVTKRSDAPPPQTTKGPTADEQRAADAKRREEERLAAIEKAAREAAARERAKKESDARELNLKLKAMKEVEAGDLCERALEGVTVPGFTLSCNRILSGGTTLDSTQLRYTVAHINECAAKCRPVARCVGFTFNANDPIGRHTCEIFGPTPEGRQVSGWVSGTR